MGRWFKVDQDELNEPREETRNGIKLQMFVSPYDIPAEVRGEYDDALNRFVIQFRYLTEPEDLVEESPDPHVKVFVGKKSKRVHRAEVDVDKLDAHAVSLVVKSLRAMSAAQPQSHRLGNYDVTSELIAKRGRQMFLEPAL